MILYKYYGYGAGKAALASRRLGFRFPRYFNDPFELTALMNATSDTYRARLRKAVAGFKQRVAILSLTRSPLNPLMWAHYGEEHSGFVIGYDVSGDFLNSTEFNLIPADAGEVIYTQTKTPFDLSDESWTAFHDVKLWSAGAPGNLPQQQLAIARRLLLTKHLDWSYEEEVRVVKMVDSLFHETADFQSEPFRAWDHLEKPDGSIVNGVHLYRCEVPIKEVYVGARNDRFHSEVDISTLGFKVHRLEVDDASWQLKVMAEPEIISASSDTGPNPV